MAPRRLGRGNRLAGGRACSVLAAGCQWQRGDLLRSHRSLTQNHKNIRSRESYEEGFSPNGVPKPMWGENGEVRSPPIWPQVKAPHDATRLCECKNQ
jgi:hypothetical protein